MSTEVVQFQHFVNKENISTNNTLLLLKRLYRYRSSIFYDLLREITGSSIDLEPRFRNQEKSEESVPDGVIWQSGFRVVIETKRSGKTFYIDQLKRHLKDFNDSDKSGLQVLIALAPEKPDQPFIKEFNDVVADFNSHNGRTVKPLCLTFSELISHLRTCLEDYEHEMVELLDEYEQFCREAALISNTTLFVRPAGITLDDDIRLGFYNDAYGEFHRSDYFGLYANKSVVAVGKLKKIIAVKGGTPKEVVFSNDSVDHLTEEDSSRLAGIIREMNITGDSYIYLVDRFVRTDFRKDSRGGLQRYKVFNIDDILRIAGEQKPEFKDADPRKLSSEDLASLLSESTWSDFGY